MSTLPSYHPTCNGLPAVRAPPRPDYLLRTTLYMLPTACLLRVPPRTTLPSLSPHQVRVPPMTGIRFEIEPDPRHWLHLVQIPEEITADDGIPRAMPQTMAHDGDAADAAAAAALFIDDDR